MLKDINFAPGKIVYDDFQINPDMALEKQIFSLKEDMFQVSFCDKYLIDIGWNPEFNLNGNFKIRIIKNFDWSNPIYFKQTNNLNTLDKSVKECIEIVKQNL